MNIQVVSLILGSIGTVGTIIAGIYAFFSSLTRLKVELYLFDVTPRSYIAFMSFTNKSRMPISITDVQIVIDGKRYSCIRVPVNAYEINKSHNGVVTMDKQVPSMDFPVNLPALSGLSGFLVFRVESQIQSQLSTPLNFVIHTNRKRSISCKFSNSTLHLKDLFQ